MRRLVLMRHAKTEGNNPGGDKARRLIPRGVQDAQEAGLALRRLGLQHALVSTAARTRETFTALGLDIPAEHLDALYMGGTDTIARLVSEVDDDITGLLVVGHAPSIPGLAATLAFRADPGDADDIGAWFPTAAYSLFTLEGSWSDLAEGIGARHEVTKRPEH